MKHRLSAVILAFVSGLAAGGCSEPQDTLRLHYGRIAYADGRYIAAGGTFSAGQSNGHAALATYDGADWSVADLGEIGPLTGIATNGRRWVAVGGTTLRPQNEPTRELVTVLISDDGATWRSAVLPPDVHLDEVVSDGTHFVATSFLSSYVYYSQDGDFWRRIHIGDALGSVATYAAGRYIMSGGGPSVVESLDGTNWEATTLDVKTI